MVYDKYGDVRKLFGDFIDRSASMDAILNEILTDLGKRVDSSAFQQVWPDCADQLDAWRKKLDVCTKKIENVNV